jgi:hypothetical protein
MTCHRNPSPTDEKQQLSLQTGWDARRGQNVASLLRVVRHSMAVVWLRSSSLFITDCKLLCLKFDNGV